MKQFEAAYPDILKAAKLITRRRNRCPYELINETYLTCSKHTKHPETKEDFLKYFGTMMKFEYIGERSSYSKINKGFTELVYEPLTDDWKQIEIEADGVSDETKDLINGLEHRDNDKIQKYINVLLFKESLPPHLNEIFNLHFERGMSSRKISEMFNQIFDFDDIHHVSFNNMIREIKERFKKWKN